MSSAVAKGGRWWTSLIKKLSLARVCTRLLARARFFHNQISLPNPAFDPSYRRIRAGHHPPAQEATQLPAHPSPGRHALERESTRASARRRRWDRAWGCRWERPTPPPGRTHAQGPFEQGRGTVPAAAVAVQARDERDLQLPVQLVVVVVAVRACCGSRARRRLT